MKKLQIICLWLILWLYFIPIATFAQNLVPNHSFEEFSRCPNDYNQGNRLSVWQPYQAVPDLFNVCAAGTNAGVPENFYGVLPAAEGNGYIGLTVWHASAQPDIIGVRLKEPLRRKKRYLVSFKVCLGSKYSSFYANNLGILFTNNPEQDVQAQKAHVLEKEIIREQSTWKTISKVIKADADYEYLLLGNFFPREATKTDKLSNADNFPAAYYFIDEVIVKPLKRKK
ncbi:MAG: hypothetical protein NZ551_10535 [Microscillaceae bacterium]|nr:hypothetical protein [Microscillaceae bacterium]MDW8461635.1 hypothetical protein [Cytophagales bacterium]